VRVLPAGTRIYSNKPAGMATDAIYFLTGRASTSIPITLDPLTRQPVTDEPGLQKMQKDLGHENGVVVFVGAISVAEEELIRKLQLKATVKTSDGRIYVAEH
jgi:hypothetical protein